MTFEKWLDTFIDEKELDRNYVFEIKYEDTTHLMKFKALTESIIALPEKHRKKIKNKLIAINIRNGNFMDFLNYVAEALIKNKT